jgi:RNA polymerase sigma factor (sigma-70 family)
VSPASLRRYRAERLLREQFRSLRASVLSDVRLGLRASGTELDERDLEACYAQAWQGLYAATLEGQEIANPPGWLRTVTRRRAIDQQRAYLRGRPAGAVADRARTREAFATPAREPAAETDVAGQLDCRTELGHLFEAVRLRLNEREQQAFALCYLQGLSRAEAARQMGVSEARLRKLIDGAGRGRGGASAKVAALAATIRRGGWCAEQGSLMRALAYGVLDPEGERHRVALIHTSSCPACRAYVASLRGLAALVPPAPALLLGLSRAGLSAGVARARSAIGAAHGAGTSVTAGSAAAASGAAGAGAAGGGWLLAGGGVGAKLAAGCLLALGLGAGCAALVTPAARPSSHPRARHHALAVTARARGEPPAARPVVQPPLAAAAAARAAPPAATRISALTSPAARAAREFGPEQATASAAGNGSAASGSSAAASRARTASAAAQFGEVQQRPQSPQQPSQPSGSSPPPSAGNAAAAEREFSPG